MTNNRQIRLSDPIAWLMKYTAPFIITFVAVGSYMASKYNPFYLLLFVFGLIYWFFRFLPLKEVVLEGNYLLISNDFKKDKVHINDIDTMTTGGWSMYLTRIHFKQQTKFGHDIIFATAQSRFGIGISDGVKNIIKQIQDNMDKQKNKTVENNPSE